MCAQTIITNHPIQFWVVFPSHKPLMILLNGQIPLKIHQSGRQWWFKKFLPKMPLGLVEIFPIHLIFKPLWWIFLMVIIGIVHKVNHLNYKVGS
jgi:hypothetical protein